MHAGSNGFSSSDERELAIRATQVFGHVDTPQLADTIVPERTLPEDPGHRAIALLARLSETQAGLEMGPIIGEGGMGLVRAATQVALGREVAVKTLKDTVRNDAAALRLLREAWATGALEHP